MRRVRSGSTVVAASSVSVSESDLSEGEEKLRVRPVEVRTLGNRVVVDEAAGFASVLERRR